MSDERKRILDLLENGMITAQEAIKLLDALEKSSQSKQHSSNDILTDFISAVTSDDDSKTKQEKGESSKKKNSDFDFDGAKDKIVDFFNTALNKVKSLEFDFQWKHSVELSHVFQQSEVELKAIDIDVSNGKVDIIPWDQDEIRLECDAKVYRTEDEEEAKKQFIENTRFGVENGTLYYSTQLKWMKVDTKVYIPKQEYDRLVVRIFNGGFQGNDLHVEKFKVKSANGKVSIENLTSENAEVETSNGAIKALNVSAHRFEAESINGKIHVEGDIKKSDIQSLNGNVVLRLKGDEADTTHIKAVTGNIDVYVPEHIALAGEAKSNLGSFKLEVEGINVVEEKNEIVQKQIRFTKLSESEHKLHIFAETKTGSVVIKNNKETNVNKEEV